MTLGMMHQNAYVLIEDIASVALHWSEITFKMEPVELTSK